MDFMIIFRLRIILGNLKTFFESTNSIFQESAKWLHPLFWDSAASKRVTENLHRVAGFTNLSAGIQDQEKQACWKELVEPAKNTQVSSDQADRQTALIFIPSVWDSGLGEMPSSASGNQKNTVFIWEKSQYLTVMVYSLISLFYSLFDSLIIFCQHIFYSLNDPVCCFYRFVSKTKYSTLLKYDVKVLSCSFIHTLFFFFFWEAPDSDPSTSSGWEMFTPPKFFAACADKRKKKNLYKHEWRKACGRCWMFVVVCERFWEDCTFLLNSPGARRRL